MPVARNRWRSLEVLESRDLLNADVVFQTHAVTDSIGINNHERFPRLSFLADLDGDGRDDFLKDGIENFGWYRSSNDSSDIQFGGVFEPFAARASQAFDMDGDGDLDLLTSAPHLFLTENLDGVGTFGEASLVTPRGSNESFDVIGAGDFDDDGDIDVTLIFWDFNQHFEIGWMENNSNKRFDYHVFSFHNPAFNPKPDTPSIIQDYNDDGLLEVPHTMPWPVQRTLDIDGDGDLDALPDFLYGNDGNLNWWKNEGASGFTKQTIELSKGVNRFFPSDVDSDNDIDFVVQLSTGRFVDDVVWLDNIHGDASEFEQRSTAIEINQSMTTPKIFRTVLPGDVDGDGDIDLVDNQPGIGIVRWYENRESGSGFVARELRSPRYDELFDVVDLDEDGKYEIVGRSAIYRQTNAAGNYEREDLSVGTNASLAVIGDFDRDTDLDLILTQRNEKLLIGENHAGDFHGLDEVGTIPTRASLFAYDIDSDNNLDIVSVAAGQVSYFPNQGTGTFETIHPLFDIQDQIFTGFEDVDGDADVDAIVFGTLGVKWIENINGSFEAQRAIHQGSARLTKLADIDGDGDFDLINAVHRKKGRWEICDQVVWFENLGDGVFGSAENIIAEFELFERCLDELHQIEFADVEGDGDLDLILAGDVSVYRGGFYYVDEARILWYENTDGKGAFEPSNGRSIGGRMLLGTRFRAEDLESDGDVDIVSSAGAVDGIFVHENLAIDNTIPGDLTGDSLVDTHDVDSICAAIVDGDTDSKFDLNHDGLIDQDDVNYMIVDLFESTLGDANLDGDFDQRDLVLVFETGQFEDDQSNNSRWSTGDWNCDGEFSTADLVLVFQTGLFQ